MRFINLKTIEKIDKWLNNSYNPNEPIRYVSLPGTKVTGVWSSPARRRPRNTRSLVAIATQYSRVPLSGTSSMPRIPFTGSEKRWWMSKPKDWRAWHGFEAKLINNNKDNTIHRCRKRWLWWELQVEAMVEARQLAM